MKISNFQKGFSFVEIILVLMIAGSIILLITNLPSSARLVGSSKYESMAKEIASRKIEELRSATYSNLTNGTTIVNDSRLSSLPSGSSQVVISDCLPSVCTGNEQIKQVSVTINWVDAGKNNKVAISTFIASGGLH